MKDRVHYWLTGPHHMWVGLITIWFSMIFTILFAIGWAGTDRFMFVCLLSGFLYCVNLWIWRFELRRSNQSNEKQE